MDDQKKGLDAGSVEDHAKNGLGERDSKPGVTEQGSVPRKQILAEAAQAYRDNQHWVPLRLVGKSPDCMGKGWTKRTLANACPAFSDGDNIGILLGAPSGDLVRLDPDFPGIPAVRHILFSEDTSMFGRASSPHSGRLVICKGLASKDFELPASMKSDRRLPQHNGKPGLVVFEILSTGKQTVVPPSVHPETGEGVIWQSTVPPAAIEGSELLWRCGVESFLLAVRQFWPLRGTRNPAAMALARVLLEALEPHYADEAKRIAVVDSLVTATAMAGGDGVASRNGKKRAKATLQKMHDGKETTGLTRLVELLGMPANVSKTFREWLGISTEAIKPGRTGTPAGNVSLKDFHAYMPAHTYIFMPTREPWPAISVNARLGRIPLVDASGRPVLNDKDEQETISASLWLDWHHPVEQMTWAPGMPALIRDRLVAEGGWFSRPKATCLNLYRPPTIILGNAAEADPWLAHIDAVYGRGDDADQIVGHIMNYFAQRVQRPEEKINHALLLGGSQGVGKDTIMEPVKRAVGPWNFSEVSPITMLGRFNGFLKSVILRVSEARDLGDVNRYQFYDHMKAYTAAPPDVLRVDEKNLREHCVLNCCGVIITTNHKTDGIYLPPDDRRHFVAWSNVTKESFSEDYWKKLWGWYNNGGDRHVAAYLTKRDLSDFDAKAPPPKTQAFWEIVNANRAPEDAELADIIDQLENPDALTIAAIRREAMGSFLDWINDRRNLRNIPHRLESCGYVQISNTARKNGLWVVGGSRQMIYAKANLSLKAQFQAAQALIRDAG